ncbi:MAG: ABC transporter ATP-binding protein [Acidimicrobiia bacterium]
MLRASGLQKRYGGVTALDGIDLTVAPGEIVGFLGPNGAGKTTTMRAIMRLLELDAGEVTWRDRPIDDATRRRFGYMPAERGMYPRMRVRDHLVYYGRLSGQSAAEATKAADGWLERLGLDERAASDVQDLSSGNQQRVQLALALLSDPEVLVLDEPFSGLDPIAVDTLSDILRERVAEGTALLLSSHQLDLVADVCSSVVIVDAGRVVLRGPVEDIRAESDHRYAEVEFAAEAETSWNPTLDGTTVVERVGRRVRVRTSPSIDPATLLADAGAWGEVRSFSFAPPDLSEVFLETVGRQR